MGGRTAEISTQEKGNLRVDFDKEAFDRLVGQKGLKLTHELAVKCSCIRDVNGSALSKCVSCGSTGIVHVDPCKIKGVIQAIGFNPKYMQYSEVNLGTALLTVRNTETLGWFDRITIEDGESVFTENIFPILRKIGGIQEASALLTYKSIKIFKVFMFIDAETQQQELVLGTDYTIDGRKFKLSQTIENDISASTEDEKKKFISIRYQHRPQYMVMDIQHDIRNSRELKNQEELLNKMPAHCIIKKTHYALNDAAFGDNAKTV